MSRRFASDITFTDQFCGAGGSSIGAKAAGLRGRMALNHWSLAIETHNTNHPEIDHDCTDVSACDPRRYPSTDILITSPECTTHSPAGGTRRSTPQYDFLKETGEDPSTVRSRATMFDVVRFAEFHKYRLIIVENVFEATRWDLFPEWLSMMHKLGYRHRVVCLNSMFAHPTPQSRDRIYVVFWRKGNRAPRLDHMPAAWCPRCEGNVASVQTWKNGRTVGKYKRQYVYTCPACRTTVTPYYYAALNAIDFTVAAERIGDRARPLKERTLERIRYGLEKYGSRQLIVRTNMTSGVACRVRGLEDAHFAQTASLLDAMFSPFLVNAQHLDGGPLARGIDEAAPTMAASNRPSLVSPFLIGTANAGGNGRYAHDGAGPMPSRTTAQDLALVSPFVVETAYSHSEARRPRDLVEPMPTQGARASAALVTPFLVMERTHNTGNPLDDPLPTACAGTVHHALIQGAAQISMRDAAAMRVAGLDAELMAQGAAPQQAIMSRAPFIVSYYGTNNTSPVDGPMPTQVGLDRHSVVAAGAEPAIDDCYFRMLQPHEIGAAMAFPGSYTVLGNKRDQVKQYGNAVTPPAMEWLVRQCVASLAPEVAA